MASSILVVGGTGNIGSRVLQGLNKLDVRTRALVRKKSTGCVFEGTGQDYVYGNLADRSSLSAALEGIDTVFFVSTDHPKMAALEGNLVSEVVQSRARKMVKISAFAASLNPPVSYGVAHKAVEDQLRESVLNWSILRPYMFMQNLFDVAKQITSRGLIPMPLGDARIGLIDTRDIADCAIKALVTSEHDGEIHMLTGSQQLTFTECAQIFSEVLGRDIRYVSPPFWLASLMMRFAGVSSWDIKMRKPLFTELKAGGEEILTDSVYRMTNRRPRTLQQFVQDYKDRFI